MAYGLTTAGAPSDLCINGAHSADSSNLQGVAITFQTVTTFPWCFASPTQPGILLEIYLVLPVSFVSVDCSYLSLCYVPHLEVASLPMHFSMTIAFLCCSCHCCCCYGKVRMYLAYVFYPSLPCHTLLPACPDNSHPGAIIAVVK